MRREKETMNMLHVCNNIITQDFKKNAKKFVKAVSTYRNNNRFVKFNIVSKKLEGFDDYKICAQYKNIEIYFTENYENINFFANIALNNYRKKNFLKKRLFVFNNMMPNFVLKEDNNDVLFVFKNYGKITPYVEGFIYGVYLIDRKTLNFAKTKDPVYFVAKILYKNNKSDEKEIFVNFMIKNELTENFVDYIEYMNPYHSFTNFSYSINNRSGGIETDISKFEKNISVEMALMMYINGDKKKVKLVSSSCLKFLGSANNLKNPLKEYVENCDETYMLRIEYFPQKEKKTSVNFFTTPLLKLQGNGEDIKYYELLNRDKMKIENKLCV